MFTKYQKFLICISLPLQVFCVQWLAERPEVVEAVYTNGLYRYISSALRVITGITAIPLGQFVFYGLVAACLSWLVLQVRALLKKQVRPAIVVQNILFGALAVLSAFYFLFTSMWGLNYYRQPVHVVVQLEQPEVTAGELEQLCQKLLCLSIETRRKITRNESEPLRLPGSKEQLLVKAAAGFDAVSRIYPALAYTYPSVKQVYVPQLMSVFGVGGIYFPFTGEANVNMDPPGFVLPATVCHEMAHQIGFASEDEANFVSYLACRLNPDPYFQYSGNLMALRYSMNRLYMLDCEAYERLQRQFTPGLVQDLEANRSYWRSFDNPIDVISSAFYDLFLKANSQPEGIYSYNKVVELLLGEFRKTGLDY